MKTPQTTFLHFIITFIRGNRAANEFSELVYEREGGALPLALWRLPFVHYHRHAVGQFRPVRVQTATPARGEPREEPGLLLTGRWHVHFFCPALQSHGCSKRIFLTRCLQRWSRLSSECAETQSHHLP